MLNLACHCGRVRIETATRPDYLHECNCSLCDPVGARWGYFHPSQVVVAGETRAYRRADKADPAVDVRFCPTCGCTTHFTLTPSGVARFGDVQLGVNMRLADEADLAGVELRYPDGRAWSGQGGFAYVRAARIIGG
jgi:hypothetical protein